MEGQSIIVMEYNGEGSVLGLCYVGAGCSWSWV